MYVEWITLLYNLQVQKSTENVIISSFTTSSIHSGFHSKHTEIIKSNIHIAESFPS